MKRFRQILEAVDPIMEAISTSAKELAKEIDDAARRETGQDKKDYMNVAKLIGANKYKEATKAMSDLDTAPLEDLITFIMGHEDVFRVMYPKARPGQSVVQFARESVEEAVSKYTSFSTQNKNRKPSLGQSKLSSAEYQKVKKLKSFNADDWKWNGDLYIRVAEDVKEEVDLDEAFMRIPKSVRGNDLVALKQSFDAMYNSLSNGGDWKPEVYKSLVKQMSSISKSAKSFNSKDDMSSMYEMKVKTSDAAMVKEEVELDEGKMKEFHVMVKKGMTAEQIAKKIGLPVKDVAEFMKDMDESVDVSEALSPKEMAQRLKLIRQAVEKINTRNAELAKKDALKMMKDSGMFDESVTDSIKK